MTQNFEKQTFVTN